MEEKPILGMVFGFETSVDGLEQLLLSRGRDMDGAPGAFRFPPLALSCFGCLIVPWQEMRVEYENFCVIFDALPSSC